MSKPESTAATSSESRPSTCDTVVKTPVSSNAALATLPLFPKLSGKGAHAGAGGGGGGGGQGTQEQSGHATGAGFRPQEAT